MAKKKYLTNERLKGKFANNFDLANFAIALAKEHIQKEEPAQLGPLVEELVKIVKEGKIEESK